MALLLISPPESACVTLAEAKAHLRVDGDDEDALIAGLIDAAQSHIDSWLGRQVMPATWKLTMTGFPAGACPIRLPRPPLIEVTDLAYVDGAGEAATIDVADLRVINGGAQASQIVLADGSDWPAADGSAGTTEITFTAGYEPAADSPPLAANAAVPASIKTAALLLIGHWYAQREESDVQGRISAIPAGVDALLAPWRVWGF